MVSRRSGELDELLSRRRQGFKDALPVRSCLVFQGSKTSTQGSFYFENSMTQLPNSVDCHF